MESRVGPSRSISHVADTVFRTVVIALAVYGALDIARSALAQDEPLYLPHIANAAEIETLSERVAELEDKLQHVTREGDDIYVTGANLHVLNGEGDTRTVNGRGNVIVGYNEARAEGHNVRNGSHMLIIGAWNNYASYGGIVAGWANATTGPWSSVLGGTSNTASGDTAIVSGGSTNIASGQWASVNGGYSNESSGQAASVSGGDENNATGMFTSICGGYSNGASGHAASICGGGENRATGSQASVSGGIENKAMGGGASVTGGYQNESMGYAASVSGGVRRRVDHAYNWRAGDLFQDR